MDNHLCCQTKQDKIAPCFLPEYSFQPSVFVFPCWNKNFSVIGALRIYVSGLIISHYKLCFDKKWNAQSFASRNKFPSLSPPMFVFSTPCVHPHKLLNTPLKYKRFWKSQQKYWYLMMIRRHFLRAIFWNVSQFLIHISTVSLLSRVRL